MTGLSLSGRMTLTHYTLALMKTLFNILTLKIHSNRSLVLFHPKQPGRVLIVDLAL